MPLPFSVSRLASFGLVEFGPEEASLSTQYEILAADDLVRAARQRVASGRRNPARVERKSVRLSPLGREFWTATDPSRHAVSQRLNGRNRVWLARRNLPVLLRPLYVGTWTAAQVVRDRSDLAALRVWFAGFREGLTSDPGERRIMSWRTVVRMTLRGRPPVI